MTPRPDCFTATQLALALGVSRKHAHRHMDDIAPQVVRVRGVEAHGWPVGALPAPLRLKLQEIADRLCYGGIAHLLAIPPEPWQPKHALEALAPLTVRKAVERKMVLAPILAAADAQLVSVAELVRRAIAGFQSLDSDLLFGGVWAVRGWIENAIERDRGLLQWERVEIYLDEKPALRTATMEKAEQISGVGGDQLGEALLAVKDTGNPTAAEKALVWDATFEEYATQVGSGVEERAVKRKLLRILNCRLPGLLPAAASARSMTWQRQFERWKQGDRRSTAFTDGCSGRAGRKPEVVLTPREKSALRGIALRTHRSNQVFALEEYADSPDCRPEVREVILRPRKSRHHMPEGLMRAAKVTAAEKAKRNGGRRGGRQGFKVRRGSFEIMEDGSRREIEAGDWWLFDDMSQNNPFWFPKIDAEDDEEAARKQQVTICRQSLMAMDLKSGRWLGCELIGRSRDSYRAEDILRFFYRLFTLYGLPRRGIILERGVWRSKIISGGHEVEVVISDDEKARVVSGLKQLGIKVKHAYDATGKACIEKGFDDYQTMAESTLPAALNIGRKPGDRPRDTKKFLRARAGIVHPRDVGMLHIEELTAGATKVMAKLNRRSKEGRIQKGVPDEGWAQSLKAKPLLPMPPELVYLFLPIQKEVVIRGGHVETTVNGRTLRFTNPAEFVHLGERHRVRVHFDASEPTLGAWVFNAESGTLNRAEHKPGQFICRADHVDDAPQAAPAGWQDENIRNRKAYNGAVRTAFCTPGIYGYGGTSASEQRDGRGNVARIERGASAGLHDAAGQTPTPKRQRGGHPRSDELEQKAKALKAGRTNAPTQDPRELELRVERKTLQAIKDGLLQPYRLTPEQEKRLEVLKKSAGQPRSAPVEEAPRRCGINPLAAMLISTDELRRSKHSRQIWRDSGLKLPQDIDDLDRPPAALTPTMADLDAEEAALRADGLLPP